MIGEISSKSWWSPSPSNQSKESFWTWIKSGISVGTLVSPKVRYARLLPPAVNACEMTIQFSLSAGLRISNDGSA